MNNMTVREFIESHSHEDLMFAMAAITHNNDYLYKLQEDIDAASKEAMMRFLAEHVITKGRNSIKMAALAGRAIKASLENPVKVRKSPIQWLKGKIKGLFQ
jgi:hypothetical protein